MLKTAAEEETRSDELWNDSDYTALREQQEYDFGLAGPWTFSMPKSTKNWQSFTSNRSKIIAAKTQSLLSMAWRQLFIDVDDEERKKRKSISNTERFAIGVLNAADRELTGVPSGKPIQDLLAWYASLRGGTAASCYFTEGKDGKPKAHLGIYDPYAVQWIEGPDGLMWFCHRNYVSRYWLEAKYPKAGDIISKGQNREWGRGGNNANVLTRLFWDDTSWKLAVNGEYIDEDEHGLGYLPVHIQSVGSAPPVHSDEYEDTLKYSWQSIYAGNRDIPDLESKLLSIEVTKGVDSGRVKGVIKIDSNLSGGVPEEIGKLKSNPDLGDSMVVLDSAKGQDFVGFVEAPDNRIIDQLLQRITGMDVLASIDPVTLSLARSGSSGAAVAEYRSAALEFINPFKKCIEGTFVWLAEESVRQYKGGNYGEMEIGGRDFRREVFTAKVNPKDIEEKHFNCNLVPDRLRDEMMELDLAERKTKAGLSSKRTAMQRHNLAEDPDKELDLIDQERHQLMASTDPVNHHLGMAAYYKDQGDEQMALYELQQAENAIKATVQQMLMGAGQGEPPPMGQPQGNGQGQNPFDGGPVGAGMQGGGMPEQGGY